MLYYRRTTEQAQVLAYADDFWLISIVFLAILPPHPADAARCMPSRTSALLARARAGWRALPVAGGMRRSPARGQRRIRAAGPAAVTAAPGSASGDMRSSATGGHRCEGNARPARRAMYRKPDIDISSRSGRSRAWRRSRSTGAAGVYDPPGYQPGASGSRARRPFSSRPARSPTTRTGA